MRLLATLGYQRVLFSKDCDYSTIIEALAKAQIVQETGPYGDRVFSVRDGDIDISLLNDADVRLPDVARPADLEKLLDVAKERDDALRAKAELERQLETLRKTIAPVAIPA